MTHVLDTSFLVSYGEGYKGVLQRLKDSASVGKVAITSPTYSELYYGSINRSENHRRSMVEFLDSFELLNTTRDSSVKLAELKNGLKDSGKNIPVMDLLIASIVIDHGATLVTQDKHFKDLEGLDVILL